MIIFLLVTGGCKIEIDPAQESSTILEKDIDQSMSSKKEIDIILNEISSDSTKSIDYNLNDEIGLLDYFTNDAQQKYKIKEFRVAQFKNDGIFTQIILFQHERNTKNSEDLMDFIEEWQFSFFEKSAITLDGTNVRRYLFKSSDGELVSYLLSYENYVFSVYSGTNEKNTEKITKELIEQINSN